MIGHIAEQFNFKFATVVFGQFPKALRHNFKHMLGNLDRWISDPQKLDIQ